MLGNKEYIGLDLREDSIHVAHIKEESGVIKLVKLDKFSLVEKIEKKTSSEAGAFSEGDDIFDEDQDADSIFGLEEEDEDIGDLDLDMDSEDMEEEDIDFDELDDEAEEEDLMSLDMVEETETAQSNEILLHNILTGIDTNRVTLGLNIRAGSAIFQIIRDTDFNEVKKKDLIEDLEQKLESIYGVSKSTDFYNYEVREDGSLVLVSIEDSPPLLDLVDRVHEMYNGKIEINEIFPDEVSLVGMIKANYELAADEITGVLQFGKSSSRILFLKGAEIWQVSPIINEGTDSKSFLNTVFSKILFQLDAGEVPNLDRIILANNSLGQEAVDFFRQNFSDLEVANFEYDEDKFDYGSLDPKVAASFTTSIATAWAASGNQKNLFPDLSFIPDYIVERQKIFKLQWHGILLLFLIFLAPLTFNYFYQQNAREINSLSTELTQINNQITQITPVVERTNQIKADLAQLREKLVLLDTLSKGTREWSTKLDMMNEGISEVRSTWITSMNQTSGGTFIEGYTLYRNRIPMVVDLFSDATLLNVNIRDVREQEVYQFSIMIKEFAENPSKAYSPPNPDELQEILNN